MFLQHLQNTNKAINLEILVCFSICTWQRLNFFSMPRGNIADGTAFFGIWQAPRTNLIHSSLQFHVQVMQLATMANTIISKKNSALLLDQLRDQSQLSHFLVLAHLHQRVASCILIPLQPDS
jgi:hypothetical protein